MAGKKLENSAIDKLNSSRGLFSSFFSSSTADESAQLFHEAGNSYILEKKFHDAIRCYMRAYVEYDKLKTHDHYAMKNLALAVKHGKQTGEFESEKLIEYMTIIAQNSGRNGKMKDHNDQYLEISSIYETNNNIKMALSVLDQCVNLDNLWFDEVIKRKSELLIKQTKYVEAGNNYENLTDIITNREKKITSYVSSRQYSLLSILCFLASNDIVSARNMYDKVINLDDMFDTSYEGNLANGVLHAIENQNISDFELACDNYNRVLKLKPLHVTLLTVAKKYISQFDETVDHTSSSNNDYNESDFC